MILVHEKRSPYKESDCPVEIRDFIESTTSEAFCMDHILLPARYISVVASSILVKEKKIATKTHQEYLLQ